MLGFIGFIVLIYIIAACCGEKGAISGLFGFLAWCLFVGLCFLGFCGLGIWFVASH